MGSRIKVMHFVSGLISGGVEQMLYNYCKFMDAEKYEFIVIYQHEPIHNCIEKIESIGCRTIRITARSENFVANLIDSFKVIKREKPDIVHAHMNLMNFCALSAAKLAGIKVRICHSHISEKNRGKMFQIFSIICKKLCILTATELYTCGQEAGIYLYGKKKMENGKVRLVENAVDLEYFKKNETARTEFRNEYRLNNKFVIGHVGRFTYQKNHERLIYIFAEILKKKPDAILLLVGTGELEKSVKEQVEQLQLDKYVIFLGTSQDMNRIYSAMDAFLLPSRYEGFPVVSIELQAADIPAVFSDTVASTCKITNAIDFLSLQENDDAWANRILDFVGKKEPCDLTKLIEKFDIRQKAKQLEQYYILALKQ